jgi:molybdopterin molybdotransferase
VVPERHEESFMKSVDQHLADVLAAVHPLPPLPLPLVDAHGCTLGEDVVATSPLPGFDNSAMDGYAVRVEDVASATPENPVTLPVVGDIAAGSNTGISIRPGFTARIMTGAPMPPGADAVVQLEWTDGGKTSVVITQAPHPGQHVRRAGEDLAEGALVLPAGTYLGAAQIGLLAAANRASAMCRPRPRVVIVSTGTELVSTGDPLGPGQIPDSNSHMLAAACREAGAIAYRVGLVRDDPALLLQTLEDHLIRADMLLTSGGVSVGAYDVVKEVLTRLGTVGFDKVAMQPGMPQGFGTLGPEHIPIVTLPGNPVSAMVSFEVFVRPAIRRMLGASVLLRPQVTVQAGEEFRSPEGKRSFLRAIVERHPTGRLTARLAGAQGSHQMAALAACNALLMIPEEQTRVEPGGSVLALLLERRGG